MNHAGLLFHAAAQKTAAHVERRFKAVKKYYFLTKGLQSAARIICAPAAHKFHTCSLRSIFFAAHVAEENDQTFFAPAGANSTRFIDKGKPPLVLSGGFPYFCSVNWRAAAPRGAQAAAATAAAAKTRPPSPRRCPDAAAACRRRTRANSTRRRGCRYTARRC